LRLIPSSPGMTILFEIPRERWLKIIASNLAKCLLVAGLVAAIFISTPYLSICGGVVFFVGLFAMCLFTMTVRIVADDKEISSFNLISSKSIAFADIRSAGIYFSCGRGTTTMLRLSGEKKENVLHIYGVSLTDKQLSEILDFIALRCLEVTGKSIEVTKLTDETPIIPSRASNKGEQNSEG
jgi:hypothetical protein